MYNKVYEIIPSHMVVCIYKYIYIHINIYIYMLFVKCKKTPPPISPKTPTAYHRKNSQPRSFFVLRVCFRLVSDG